MPKPIQVASIRFAVCLICGLACAVGTQEKSAASARRADSRPNIIVFFTDDQGYNDLGCFGSPQIETPNFDQMAKEGTRFTSFYAQNVCGPSRAALLTGSYPIRCAEPANHKNPHTVLHPQELTVAEILKAAGYATACIGKWHVGGNGNIRRTKEGTYFYEPLLPPAGAGPFLAELMPNAQGFDRFFGYTYLQALRQDRWKLVLPRPENPAWTVWYGRMIEAIEQPELYDLRNDISESQDVAADHPEVIARLIARVEEIRVTHGDYDRIGSDVRCFDPGPHRPDMDDWEK